MKYDKAVKRIISKYTIKEIHLNTVTGARMGGWVTNYLKSKYVPETLSFSKIYSERAFSKCNSFLTDRPTDGPTNLLIEATFLVLKNCNYSDIVPIRWEGGQSKSL